MRYFLPLCSMFILSACASRPPSTTPPQIFEDTTNENIYSPSLGQKNEIMVGDSLLKEGIKTTNQKYEIKLLNDGKASLDNGYTTTVKRNDIGNKFILKNSYTAFCEGVYARSGAVDLLGGSSKACLVDFDNDNHFESVMFSNYDKYFSLTPSVQYQTSPLPIDSKVIDKSFWREAVFQGLEEGKIKILFREYKNNLIRAAFNQTITYELDKNGQSLIAFKGFQAKVHSASSTKITYTVITPFSN
ncbi:MAG: hypothetical protein ACTJH9_07505 [Pseudoalteromonas sp.]|uniref:hypothetical protein n=1 Tax=Pseudoalteromonas sp. TaxID=53249 RepID=UPI003F978C7F